MIYDTLINLIVVLLLTIGVFFMLSGTIGFARFPDFYSRMHATGKCDTLGEGLMLVALIIYEVAYTGVCEGPLKNALLVGVKMLFLIMFILLANPTSTHAIAKAAYDVGLEPWRKPDETIACLDTGRGEGDDEDGGETS